MDKKLKFFFGFTWFLLILLIVVVVLLYTVKIPQGAVGPQGIQGPKGDVGMAERIDYKSLNDIIDDKFNLIDPPKNGYTPQKNSDYFDGDKGDAGPKGDTGDKGDAGSNGLNGESPQIRWNPETKSFETKLPSEDFWTVVLDVCVEFQTLCGAGDGLPR